MDRFSQKFSVYYEYFENIRSRVYSLAVVFGVFFIIGFFNAGTVLKVIISFFNLQDASVVTTSPFQFLDLATKIGMYSGLFFCFPVLIYHIYDFLKDGLSKKEKRLFFILLPISLVLFVAGFSYCFSILYFYLNSVSAINIGFGIKNVWDINSFLSQIIYSSVVFGLIFESPIILTFLIRIGLLDVDLLRRNKIYVISGMFIFVGFLPPPDIFSTIIQVLPLITLYQITLWVNKGYNNSSKRIIKTSSFPINKDIINDVKL